jgi:anti-sigma28 factor (negative regulator of flagellin synthesis)
MRVNNVHLTYVPVTQPEARQAAAARAAEGSEASASQASSHVPSSELQDLLKQVRQEPEVRQDRVREVAQRLANGYYLSAEAADRTAEAIQRTPE